MNRSFFLLLINIVFIPLLTIAGEHNQSFAKTIQLLPNLGQIKNQYGATRNDIDARVDGGAVTMFVGSGQLHYQWVKTLPVHSDQEAQTNPFDLFEQETTPQEPTKIESYRLDVTLVGANPHVEPVFLEPTGYTEHYYKEYTGEAGMHLQGYGRLVYKNMYPGIDWVIYTAGGNRIEGDTGSGIKYDFIVHPGADPGMIHLRYEGATNLALVDGALVVEAPFGSIRENAPYSYTATDRQTVASAYVLEGNELSFATGKYTGSLVIDPTLRWATYYAGSSGSYARDVAVSGDGYVYLAGRTNSTNNIATTGAHQVSYAGSYDAFLARLDDSCQVKWATYYGGDSLELTHSLAVDKTGNVYIGGYTDSDTGIATAGSHKQYMANDKDGFIAKFDENGQRLWGTYYGGRGNDKILDMICDNAGNLYFCGATNSDTGIATSGTFQDTVINAGSNNSFIAALSSSGQRLWGTYHKEIGLGSIACDNNGYIYAAGGAPTIYSNKATSGAHQYNQGGGLSDGFLCKFNQSGQQVWATNYGGSNNDAFYAVACNDSGHVYAAGYTRSSNNIASTNAYKNTPAGSDDAFLVKFNASGTRLWGTYYGGSGVDMACNLAVQPEGNVFLLGLTSSTSGIATNNALKYAYGGGSNDAMLLEFTPAGQLTYGSYYGGSGLDLDQDYTYQGNIAYSHEGMLYFGSSTSSTGSVATNNGTYQSSYQGGWYNAYLVAMFTDTVVYIKQKYTDTVWCPGDTVRIVYGVNQDFNSGNTFKVQLSNAAGSFSSPVIIGSKAISVKDTITCVIPLSTPAGSGYRIRITGDNPSRLSLDNDVDIRIKAVPSAFSNSSNTPVCTTDSIKLTGATSSTGVTWVWSGPNGFSSVARDTFIANSSMSHAGDYILTATLTATGCSLSDTTTLVMKPTPQKPTAGSNSPVCETKTLTLNTTTNTPGVSYTWNGPSGYSSSTQNPTVTADAANTHAGSYISTVTINGCSNRDTTVVVVKPKPAMPSASAPNSPICARQDIQLAATTITGAAYEWTGANGFTATLQNPTRLYASYNDSGMYYVHAILNGCLSDTDSVRVVVNKDPFVNIYPSPGVSVCTGAAAQFTAVPNIGTGSATYSWLVNNSPAGSGLSYITAALNNGDEVYCLMTSTGNCATPFIDTSNKITMSVMPITTPTVNISSEPSGSVHPNEPIKFTATATDAGSNPGYQWQRNGVDIVGATGQTWAANANTLADGDEICLQLTSSDPCPSTPVVKSNCIKLDIRVGINDINANNAIHIYPNPVKEVLMIEGAKKGTKAELHNMLGQRLDIAVNVQPGGTIKADTRALPVGHYLLMLTAPDGARNVYRFVKE